MNNPWEDPLFETLYHQFRAIAQAELSAKHTTVRDATSLLNDALLNLPGDFRPKNAGHFKATVGRAIRFALVDSFRSQNAQKRGGGRQQIAMEDIAGSMAERGDLETLKVLLDAIESFCVNHDSSDETILEQKHLLYKTDDDIAETLGLPIARVRATCLLFERHLKDYLAKPHR